MFTPFVRFIILLICALISIIASLFNIWSLLIFSALISCYILWDYYKQGTVPLSLLSLSKNNYLSTEKVLSHTTHPERLTKKNRAYYFFIKGMIEREKDNYATAVPFFELALEEGIKNEHYKAMSLLALTDMAMIDHDKEKARTYLYKMKNLKVKPSLIPSIRKMQEWIESDESGELVK